MGRSKLSALARSLTLLASVGAPCLAHAADLLPPPPPPLPLPPPPVEIGGGWYLRGDVGVGAAGYEDITTTVSKGGALPPGYAIQQATLGDQAFAGGGIGYQVNNFFWGDVTAQYRGGGRLSFVETFDLAYPDHTPATGIDLNTAKFSSVVFMANGYLGMGTWCGFTPFLTGGVGVAYHHIAGYTDIGAGSAAGGFGIAKSRWTSDLAYTVGAGVSYDITPNFKVDVGYSYINMGSAKVGPVQCINSPDCAQASYKIKQIDSHDVRIGLRYLLGGPVAAPLPPLAPAYEPPPGPIVRKY